MTLLDHFIGLFSLSVGFWGLFCLYCIFSVKKFIVKRYEHETNLTDTIFFNEHFTFAKYKPDFLKSGLYATHLTMCLWAWRFYGKKKIFRDIDNPEIVISHFSKKEIFRVKRVVVIAGIITFHCIAFYIIRYIWPEVYD